MPAPVRLHSAIAAMFSSDPNPTKRVGTAKPAAAPRAISLELRSGAVVGHRRAAAATSNENATPSTQPQKNVVGA